MGKRSHRAALVILGAAAFGLAGCQDTETDAAAFPDLASCVEAAKGGAGWFSEADCTSAFAEAETLHAETAPRYDNQALCEEEHGAGACGNDPVVQPDDSHRSIFMPLLTGYLIGQALGGGRGVTAQPLVRTPNGYSTPSGATQLRNNSGSGKMATAAFAKAPTTLGKPPMTKATVASRGGFGSSAGGRVGG